ncbi:uncharacterized protein LOC107304789 [Oryza brachyantha]|uniref:uncharacterized protein LOC107304789 n=1 Tax=Oryza brachyantha TaxID=4533 RepID=UPI001ADCEADF|nr:uncharacterized protein LOC107304789 [Oryza brachyantha]
MDSRTRFLIYAAASYMLLSMMAMVIESRNKKRKRVPRREGITYGPIDERDRKRFDYLNDKIWKNDTICVNMLRLRRAPFFRFCKLFRDGGLLVDTIHMSVEEQVAMFLHTIGHNVRNRVVATDFYRSGETVSRYFNLVLRAIGEMRKELIRPPSITTPSKILGNPRWDPYLRYDPHLDCVGAIDGTHVRVSVSKDMEPSFRGRKDHATQNVMAAVDFDLKFTYVLAGWEGTAHDAVVLRDAIERTDGLRVPQGKFYPVDAGYGAKPGFLPPFRGVRYHLNEWGTNPVQNEKELFNLRHSSLRVTVERAFGSLKRRWKILDDATPFFPYPTQVDIVVACCIIQNWIIEDGGDDFIISEEEWIANYSYATSRSGQASEHAYMVQFSGQSDKGGHVTWTSSMSTYMLEYLEGIVASGNKTSSGFKQVHLKACAKALNDHFKINLTSDQITNHMRTWKRKYSKIADLRKLSGALWDEENFIISLDHKHYADHIKDHKADAEYLNKPIHNYGKMLVIFGNSLATGKYAKGSSDPLATESIPIDEEEEQIGIDSAAETGSTCRVHPLNEENGASSSAPKPKKAKIVAAIEEEGLIGAFKSVGEKLAGAILEAGKEAAKSYKDLPDNLYESVHSIPRFEDTHLAHYFAHLVDNPPTASVFVTLEFAHKVTWVARYIATTFNG